MSSHSKNGMLCKFVNSIHLFSSARIFSISPRYNARSAQKKYITQWTVSDACFYLARPDFLSAYLVESASERDGYVPPSNLLAFQPHLSPIVKWPMGRADKSINPDLFCQSEWPDR